METFSTLLALCAGNSPVTGEFPTQRPVTRSFDVSFDMRLNKQLSKQWKRRWFETHRAHYDVIVMITEESPTTSYWMWYYGNKRHWKLGNHVMTSVTMKLNDENAFQMSSAKMAASLFKRSSPKLDFDNKDIWCDHAFSDDGTVFPKNIHTVFGFVVWWFNSGKFHLYSSGLIRWHWGILNAGQLYPYTSGLLHWHCGRLPQCRWSNPEEIWWTIHTNQWRTDNLITGK